MPRGKYIPAYARKETKENPFVTACWKGDYKYVQRNLAEREENDLYLLCITPGMIRYETAFPITPMHAACCQGKLKIMQVFHPTHQLFFSYYIPLLFLYVECLNKVFFMVLWLFPYCMFGSVVDVDQCRSG